MTIHELRNKFISLKKYEPLDANELLDFARQNYLHNNLSITDYRSLVRELEKEGAKKPEDITDELVGQ